MSRVTQILSEICLFLVIMSVPVLIYLGGFISSFSDTDYYKEEFEKYNIYIKFSKIDVDKFNNDLLNYLKYEKEDKLFESDILSEREKEHLLDVKDLVQKAHNLFLILIIVDVFILILLPILQRRMIAVHLAQIISYGGMYTLLLSTLLLFIIYYSFEAFFYYFHVVLFKNDLWMLEPTDTLINLYPLKFFYDFGFKIFLIAILTSIAMVFVGLFFLYINKKFFKEAGYLH